MVIMVFQFYKTLGSFYLLLYHIFMLFATLIPDIFGV